MKKQTIQASFGFLFTFFPAVTLAVDLEPINNPFPDVNLPIFNACRKASGIPCNLQELTTPGIKQVLVLPAGFAEGQNQEFFQAYERFLMTVASSPSTIFTKQYEDRILYIARWVPGGALSSGQSNFSARIAPSSFRPGASFASLDRDTVDAKVLELKANQPGLDPSAVVVLFNSSVDPDTLTESAIPPLVTHKNYGIASLAVSQLENGYLVQHEMAHAMLNFVDEYIESGFESLTIRSFGAVTPLLLLDGTWGGFVTAISDLLGIYDYNFSEVLANNGNDNISINRTPSRVSSGLPTEIYDQEGGLYFGRGTFHMSANTIMENQAEATFTHSESQSRVITDFFDGTKTRANDRIRIAGPRGSWPGRFGSTRGLIMDADKNHHVHPTESYTVELGWYERVWKTCYAGFIPYPCSENVWKTVTRSYSAQNRNMEISLSNLFALRGLALATLCKMGGFGMNGPTYQLLCEERELNFANNFLPKVSFTVPYQEVALPASNAFTTYYWRFKTFNGVRESGWTGWSSFYRSF